MTDMSEKETRGEVINPQLEKAGWKVNLKKYIKEERPWDLFQEKQLAEIVQKCQKIKMK